MLKGGLYRAPGFKQDVQHYLGATWQAQLGTKSQALKDYEVRVCSRVYGKCEACLAAAGVSRRAGWAVPACWPRTSVSSALTRSTRSPARVLCRATLPPHPY